MKLQEYPLNIKDTEVHIWIVEIGLFYCRDWTILNSVTILKNYTQKYNIH